VQAGRAQGGDVVYDAALSREAVLRVQDRINGLIPAGARVLECGAGPLSPHLFNRFDYTLLDNGTAVFRWDVPHENIITFPERSTGEGLWFDLEHDALPSKFDLLILHDVSGVFDVSVALADDALIARASMVVVVGDDGERIAELVSPFPSPIALIDEPDVGMWHFEPVTTEIIVPAERLDLITRVFHVLNWKGLERRRLRRLSKNNNSSIPVREALARMLAVPGTWEEASEAYSQLFDLAPGYRDVAWQLLRTSIYAAQWPEVGRVLMQQPSLGTDPAVQTMLKKKFSLIGKQGTTQAIERIISSFHAPSWLIQTWAEQAGGIQRDYNAPVSHLASEALPGPHLGHRYLRMIELGDHELMVHQIEGAVEAYGIVETLGSICVDEHLPDQLNDVVKGLLSRCEAEEIHSAIRAIGRRGDPAQFVGRASILKMIESGTSIQTWMIEFALRSEDRSMLDTLLTKSLPGTGSAVIDALDNLISQRRDNRSVDLLDALAAVPSLHANQAIRRAIAKALLSVAEPALALSYARECIELEPQDAVCGTVALDAAIATGRPDLILPAADLVFNMRSRSKYIDYASVAVAAIRSGQNGFAEDILRRNRLRMDVKAQRIRVGLPFHSNDDFEGTLAEVEITPNKFRKDPTILIYEALALSKLWRHEEAEHVAMQIQDPSERAALLYKLRRSWKDYVGAVEAWETALETRSQSPMPLEWRAQQGAFLTLYSPARAVKQAFIGPLVSVIMTVHKWNDAFPLAVNSILNQTHKNIELIVVDDFSPETDLDRYNTLLTDERVIRVRMQRNVGTYACRNAGLDIARGEFITFADSDDWNHPQRIHNAVERMERDKIDLCVGRYIRMNLDGDVQFNGGKLSRFALMSMMIRKSTLDEHQIRFDGRARTSADSELFDRLRLMLGPDRVRRHSGLDVVALHHDESLTGGGVHAIDWTGPGPKRLAYVRGYEQHHDFLMKNREYGMASLHFAPPSDAILADDAPIHHIRLRHAFGLLVEANPSPSHQSGDEPVHVFMATYPGGFDKVGDAVRSLLTQSVPIESLTLHVNGTTRPPNIPRDPRVSVALSEINHADNGKFLHMEGKTGFFLTVDDDLDYPIDYVEHMVAEIERHGRKAIVGVHGAKLPFGPPLTRWSQYKELRRSHVFTNEHGSRLPMDVLGTGTVGFHSSLGHPSALQMDSLRMVDLHVAVWARKRKIPMFLIPRRRDWLKEFPDVGGERIWAVTQEDRGLQWDMLRVLKKEKFWATPCPFGLKLNYGPLNNAMNWENREIPVGLSLPAVREWPELRPNPKVTIYIPAFNASEYVVECVESALAQSYTNFEVCVHDDGSTDDTLQVLNRHFNQDGRVRISSHENLGIGGASNKAIRNGSGDLILQLDSDDIIEPDCLESLVSAIGVNVCAYGNFRRIERDGTLIDDGWEEPEFSRERLLRSMIVHPPRLFRRDAWEAVGGHNEMLTNAVDFDFYTRLAEIGTMIHVRKILYSYRILQTSTSRTKEDMQTKNTHDVIRSSLRRQGIDAFDIHIPNPKYPRRVVIQDTRFNQSE